MRHLKIRNIIGGIFSIIILVSCNRNPYPINEIDDLSKCDSPVMVKNWKTIGPFDYTSKANWSDLESPKLKDSLDKTDYQLNLWMAGVKKS